MTSTVPTTCSSRGGGQPQPQPQPHDGSGGGVNANVNVNNLNNMNNNNFPPHSDDVEEELHRVNFALEVVFSPSHIHTAAAATDSPIQLLANRSAADRYLTTFQRLPISWMVCDRLLQLEAPPSASSYLLFMLHQQRSFFAAQTLHRKCRSDVHQLPVESLPSLRDSLVQQLKKYILIRGGKNDRNKPFITQLSMAIASLSIQMRWTSVIGDLLTNVSTAVQQHQQQQHSSSSLQITETASITLQILHALPEECTSEQLCLQDENVRYEFQDLLIQNSLKVLDFLYQYPALVQSQEEKNLVPLYQAFHSWVRYVHIPPHVLCNSPLIDVAFETLATTCHASFKHPSSDDYDNGEGGGGGPLFEILIDVIVELLRMYPSHYDANRKLVERMIPLVMSLGVSPPRQQEAANYDATIIAAGTSAQYQQQQHHPPPSTATMATATTATTQSLLELTLQKTRDEDVLRGLTRIFTEMGESYMSLIMSTEELNQILLVELVLRCTSATTLESNVDHNNDNNDIPTITLHFWYTFIQELEALEPFEFRQVRVDDYTPLLLRLLHVCVTTLLRYPHDVDELKEDQLDDVNRTRFYVADTIEDCCRLLGGNVVLHHIGNILREQQITQYSQHIHQHHQQQQQILDWRGIEATFFALHSISRYIPRDEKDVIPLVMSFLVKLSTSSTTTTTTTIPPYLRYTACLLIGKYSHWLLFMSPNQYMEPLMPFLAHSLSIPKCSSAASIAIKELCECSSMSSSSTDPQQSLNLGEPVLQLYEQIVLARQQNELQQQHADVGGFGDAASSRIKGASSLSSSFELDLRDELEILEGACKAISKQLNSTIHEQNPDYTNQQVSSYLNRIVQPIGTRLASYVSSSRNDTDGDGTSSSSRKQIIAEVDRLTVILRFFKLQTPYHHYQRQQQPVTIINPTTEIISQSWSLLDTVTQQHPRDFMLAEKICRLHKHSMRSCGRVAYAPFLDALLTQLVRNFGQSFQSPYLYAASICVTEYGSDDAYVPRLFSMIQAMASASFTKLSTPSEFTSHPDVVEELFYLMGRVISYCPEPLVCNRPLLRSLLQCATVGMQLDHRDANRGTMNFLERTVSFGVSLGSSEGGVSDSDVDGLSSSSRHSSARSPEKTQECMVALESAIFEEGQNIVTNLARALMGDLPAYCIDTGSGSIAGILWKLNILCPDLLLRWIQHAVMPSPERERNDFLGSIANRVSRDEFILSVRAFRSACDRSRRVSGGNLVGKA